LHLRVVRHSESARAARTFADHVANSYGALVDVLAELRAAGRFADDIFLIVYSSDPGPDMERRELDALARLNREEVVKAYKSAAR